MHLKVIPPYVYRRFSVISRNRIVLLTKTIYQGDMRVWVSTEPASRVGYGSGDSPMPPMLRVVRELMWPGNVLRQERMELLAEGGG